MTKSQVRTLLLTTTAALVIPAACSQPAQPPAPPPPDLSAIEANIRSMDKDWSAAAAAKDVEKATSYYAEDGQFFEQGAPVAAGRDAIHKSFTDLLTSPSYVSLMFAPTAVHVAQAGDMAYEIGTYELTMKDKKGKPVTDKGKYVVVWKKQADGSWKVEADIPNSDMH
jgi:uncharacterized protein (TIGR02246 family)